MWLLRILNILLGLLMAGIVEANDVNLRVTVRKDVIRNVTACRHSFSQVELLNLNKHENLQIESVYSLPEETFVREHDSGSEFVPVHEALHQQIYVSKFQSGSLSLEPEQLALVPISFLPCYPHSQVDEIDLNSPQSADTAPPLSAYQYADLADLVGKATLERSTSYREYRRNNLDYKHNDRAREYEVRTTLVVKTQKGIVTLPIKASSSRQNPFEIPDRIMFPAKKAPPSKSKQQIDRDSVFVLKAINRDAYQERNRLDWFKDTCFDVFMKNPYEDKDIRIIDVQLSKPGLATLYDAELDPEMKNPSSSITDWGGEFWLDNEGPKRYLVTVCPRLDTKDVLEKAEQFTRNAFGHLVGASLGYLQIRADSDNLFTILEQQILMEPPKPPRQVLERIPQTPVSEAPSVLNQPTVNASSRSQSVYHLSPSKMKIHIIPFVTPKTVQSITIRNPSSKPIQIMRVSLSFENTIRPLLSEMGLRFDIEIRQGVKCENLGQASSTVDCSSNVIVYPESLVRDFLSLRASVNSTLTTEFLAKRPRRTRFSGTLVVRATNSMDLSFQDWKNQLHRNPYQDHHLVVEVPFVVHFINSEIHAVLEDTNFRGASQLAHEFPISGIKSIQALFYPFRHFASRPWRNWGSSAKGRTFDYTFGAIVHNLNIVSTTHFPLNISNVEIIDQNHEDISLCNRFWAFANPPAARKKNGLFDLGTITLAYEFNIEQEMKWGIDLGEARYCKLAFSTIPVDTGVHEILLDIFSGTLNIASRSDVLFEGDLGSSSVSANKKELDRRIRFGHVDVMSWLNDRGVGAALRNHLFKHYKRFLPKSEVFGAYFASLADVAQFEGKLVEPLLVQVGAIRHGETKEVSIYVTNLNPMPVQVFVDVSKTEGASIALAREPTRTKGDGNAVLDFLPPQENPGPQSQIEKGSWKSHSRDGLRQFLQSSSLPSKLFSSLPYREAISMSTVAVKTLPHLGKLYQEKARVRFHSKPWPTHFYSSVESECDDPKQNPNLHKDLVFNDPDTPVDEYSPPGPLLISDDSKVVHPVDICDPSLTQASSDRNMMHYRHAPVSIPPGGVAKFDIKVRAPPGYSQEKDVTPFISTGLTLSTDHGEAIPVLVAFESLMGRLKVSSKNETVKDRRNQNVDTARTKQGSYEEIIEVKPRLFHETGADQDGMALSEAGVPLYVTSTFSREVSLRSVESCNPWFRVDLLQKRLKADSPEKVGVLDSEVRCPSTDEILADYPEVPLPTMEPLFFSFYQCAIRWLKERTRLQPAGCGLSKTPTEKDSNLRDEDSAVSRAIKALTNAISFSVFKYGVLEMRHHSDDAILLQNETKALYMAQYGIDNPRHYRFMSGSSRGSEELDWLSINIFSEVSDAWRVISQLGLHTISSSLRATVEYAFPPSKNSPKQTNSNSTQRTSRNESNRQSVTVSMNELAVTSSLVMPQLFPSDAESKQREDDDTNFISYVEFPATTVGNLAATWIPLQNPTGVPVKVKLSVLAHPEFQASDNEDEVIAPEEVRERYLQNYGRIYAQQAYGNPLERQFDPWWDGAGTYFLPDDNGNLLHSLKNGTLPVRRAKVRLDNPSLSASSAFVVGCGIRCGLNDERGNQLSSRSPIGASAAAGITLVGRQRPLKENSSDNDEPFLAPGGDFTFDGSPAAFAVPYSAFDEIVVSPHGKAELGPIFFRPPGKYSVLGCDTSIDMDTLPFGVKFSKACGAPEFEATIFLENSLTGLERVVMRGQALWEKVAFLDATTSDAPDEYGDVEYRFGRSTLVFPGTAVAEPKSLFKTVTHPIIKAVTIVNDGDTVVQFKRVYFSDAQTITRRGPAKTRTFSANREVAGCSYRGFRMLGCKDDDEALIKGARGLYYNNFKFGLELRPGETEIIYIEHTPDCTHQSDYVMLNFALLELAERGDGESTRSSRRMRADEWTPQFRRQPVELLVGYDMTDAEFRVCQPVHVRDLNEGIFVGGLNNVSEWNGEVDRDRLREKLFLPKELIAEIKMAIAMETSMLPFFRGLTWNILRLGFLMSVAILVSGSLIYRWRTSRRFRMILRIIRPKNESGEASFNISWLAAFRCLARVDPTPLELQTVGREQTKQILFGKYKSVGALIPQLVDGSGMITRDKNRGRSGGTRLSREENEKRLTISEAVFRRSHTSATKDTKVALPIGLDWRLAITRGVTKKGYRTAGLTLKSELIKKQKRSALLAGATTEGVAEAVVVSTMEQKSDEATDVGDDRQEDVVVVTEAGSMQQARVQIQEESPNNNQVADAVSTSDSEGQFAKEEGMHRSSVSNSVVENAEEGASPHGAKLPPQDPRRPVHDTSKSYEKAKARGLEPGTNDHDGVGSLNACATELSVASKHPSSKQTGNKNSRSRRSRAKASSPTHWAGGRRKAAKMDESSSESSVSRSNSTKKEKQPSSSHVQDRKTSERSASKKKQKKARVEKLTIEPPSPVSHRSVSSMRSASSKSTDITSSPKRDGFDSGPTSPALQGIRPPPGLAPPPGFGTNFFDSNNLSAPGDFLDAPLPPSDGTTPPQIPFDDNSVAALKLLSSPATPAAAAGDGDNTPFLIQKILEGDEMPLSSPQADFLPHDSAALLSLVETPTALLQEEPQPRSQQDNGGDDDDDSSALLGLGSGFNVMNFLDNILDETQAQEAEEEPHVVEPPTSTSSSKLAFALAETNEESDGAFDAAATPVLTSIISSDPWAAPSRSRAAAYGIAVGEDPHVTSIVEAFLATPPAIDAVLGSEQQQQQQYERKEEYEQEDVYTSGSFFSEVHE